MKRFWVILVLGLALGAGTFATVFQLRTRDYRALRASPASELAWIQQEFQLNEEAFREVRSLHEAYKPVCAEMCRRIDAKNAELTRLLSQSDSLSPEIERVVTEVAMLTKECRLKMLQHFFQVSRAMPREQGRKYLVWMQEQTLTPSHQSMTVQAPGAANQHGHEH